MASIVSKLARAAFATRAPPSAVEGIPRGGRRADAISVSPADAISVSPADAISVSPADAIHVSPAGGPSSEDERARSKPEVAEYRTILHPSPDVDENVLKSDEAMWAFYEHWCKFHGISRDRREMERRFKIFSNSAREVYEFNNSVVDGKLGMTKFADMTKKEKSLRLGYRRSRK